jgi:uncharacterized membrane protein
MSSNDPQRSSRHSKTIQLCLTIAVIVLSLWFAAVHIRNSSIWYDEAITLLTTSGHANLDWSLGQAQFKPSADLGKILVDLYQRDVHPPLYFWTLAIWRVALGPSLEVARSLSALFTIATLWLLYRYAISLGIKWPAVPAIVYALSAVGLRYAYNARPYAMASFLVVLTLNAAHKKSRFTGLFAAACVATHYFTALCVAPVLLFECINQWRLRRDWAYLTASSFVLACIPLLPLLRVHFAARPHQYPGFTTFPHEVWALAKGSMESGMPSTWLPHWGFALLIAACFAILGIYSSMKESKLVLPFSYVAFLTGFLLLALITNKSIVKMPTDYYLGLGCPFLVLLIAAGVAAYPRPSALLGALVLLGTLSPTSMTKFTDYRQMVKQIHQQCPNCPILVGAGYAGAIPACVLYESKTQRRSSTVHGRSADTYPCARE